MLHRFREQVKASVPFPLTNAFDKSKQHRNKFLGMPRMEPGAATSVLCRYTLLASLDSRTSLIRGLSYKDAQHFTN